MVSFCVCPTWNVQLLKITEGQITALLWSSTSAYPLSRRKRGKGGASCFDSAEPRMLLRCLFPDEHGRGLSDSGSDARWRAELLRTSSNCFALPELGTRVEHGGNRGGCDLAYKEACWCRGDEAGAGVQGLQEAVFYYSLQTVEPRWPRWYNYVLL